MSVLDNKIGGVPVVFVGGGVGLLVVGALYLQSKNSADTSAASNLQAYPEIGNGGVNESSEPLTDDGSSFQSNATWMAQAVAFLIKTGASPFTVSTALTKYLAGASLTEAELELVNAAITKLGLPPQGVQGLSEIIRDTVTTPVVTPPVAVPAASGEVGHLSTATQGEKVTGSYLTTSKNTKTGATSQIRMSVAETAVYKATGKLPAWATTGGSDDGTFK